MSISGSYEIPAPNCTFCQSETTRSGGEVKHLRACAIELTEARLAASARPKRAAAIAGTEAQKKQRQEYGIEEDDDDDDPEWANISPRGYNLHMRLTPGPYADAAVYNFDQQNTVSYSRQISGPAGREQLNRVMADYFNITVKPDRYSAWRHAGVTPWKINNKASNEWCHLVADSLGGPSVAHNLVSASYSANTYMAALEALLKGQTELTVTVTAYCHAAHVAECIDYKISKGVKEYQVRINGRAMGFNAAQLVAVQTNLKAWLQTVGISVEISA